MEIKEYYTDNNYTVYRIIQDKHFLTYQKFYESIGLTTKLVYDIISTLKSTSSESYFLEFKPVSWDLLGETFFEYVIIKTSGFIRKTDIITFGESNLNTNTNNIYTFYNLSKSSILISPCYNHNYNINIYNNIGTFMRSLNLEQQFLLFVTVFTQYLTQLKKNQNKLLWLSTHGKGVAWLHFRIDNSPKYISYPYYKN
jgi:hypothetical protein